MNIHRMLPLRSGTRVYAPGEVDSFGEIWSRADQIGGWLTERQARRLFDAASTVACDEAIVEIGSHFGRSTVVLAAAKQAGTTLVAVDPFDDDRWGGGSDALATFRANLEAHGVDPDAVHLQQYGAAAGRRWRGGPVGLLFVDGAHDYPTVIDDLRAWLPHLSPSATVMLHDAYSSPGVTGAAFREMFGASKFRYVGSTRSLAAFKRGELGMLGRLDSSLRMLARLPWLGRNLTIKVAIRRGWRWPALLLGHRQDAFPY